METKRRKVGATDLVLLILSILFLAGILTVFGPCGPTEDGSFMTCHWAGNTVAGLAAVLVVLSLIHLAVSDPKIKTGLSAAAVPVALLAAYTPGGLIHLCMMGSMQCRAVMRPAAILLSVLVIAAAIFDIAVNRKTCK